MHPLLQTFNRFSATIVSAPAHFFHIIQLPLVLVFQLILPRTAQPAYSWHSTLNRLLYIPIHRILQPLTTSVTYGSLYLSQRSLLRKLYTPIIRRRIFLSKGTTILSSPLSSVHALIPYD